MGAGAINELKEDPIKLAIGRTVTGGSIGMAALDGYAAAIEVFVFYPIFAYIHSVLRFVRCSTLLRVASTRSLYVP